MFPHTVTGAFTGTLTPEPCEADEPPEKAPLEEAPPDDEPPEVEPPQLAL